jgi:hypothetical protein
VLISVNSCDRVFWKPRCFLTAWPSLLLWLLQDRSWFETQLEGHLSSHFSLSRDEVLGSDGGRLVYGDFMVPGADPKNYEQVRGGWFVVLQVFSLVAFGVCMRREAASSVSLVGRGGGGKLACSFTLPSHLHHVGTLGDDPVAFHAAVGTSCYFVLCLILVIRVCPCPLCQVKHLSALIPTINEYLLDYNAESKTPMGLVMFMDAVEHVSRISRILRQVRCTPEAPGGCHTMCTPQPSFFSRTTNSSPCCVFKPGVRLPLHCARHR